MSVYLFIFFFLISGFYNVNRYLYIKDSTFYKFFLFFIIIFVGFRYGLTDFFLYQNLYEIISMQNIDEFIKESFKGDFLYNFTNWFFAKLNLGLVGKINLGLVGVNIFCSIMLILAVDNFGKSLSNTENKNKWLIWIICFQTFLMFLAMGYVRQGFAIFFICIAINKLIKTKIFASFLLIIIAFFFHKSSIFFLILYFLFLKKKYFKYLIIVFIPILFFIYIEREQFQRLVYFYLGHGQHMISIGIIPRLSVSLIASIIFFLYKDSLCENIIEKKIYFLLSFIVFFIVPVSLVSSTFADRVLLYLFPVQILVFSRLGYIQKNDYDKKLVNFSVILFYFSLLLFWFKFSNTAAAWYPYENYLFLTD